MPLTTEITTSQLSCLVDLPNAPTIVDVRIRGRVPRRHAPAASQVWFSISRGGTFALVVSDRAHSNHKGGDAAPPRWPDGRRPQRHYYLDIRHCLNGGNAPWLTQ
jgi:hypothetical protein